MQVTKGVVLDACDRAIRHHSSKLNKTRFYREVHERELSRASVLKNRMNQSLENLVLITDLERDFLDGWWK